MDAIAIRCITDLDENDGGYLQVPLMQPTRYPDSTLVSVEWEADKVIHTWVSYRPS